MSIQTLQETLDRYTIYLQQDTNNPHLLLTTGLLKAQILHFQHHITDAIALLEELQQHHKPHAEIAGLLSLLYFDHQDAIRAASFSATARSLDPSNYHGQLVELLLDALQNNAELDKINALIATHPLDARLWFVLGTTQLRHMNIPAAEQALLQATTIHPGFYDSWICAGWCYLLQNNVIKAHEAYQKAMQIDSKSADGWGGIALVYALQNNLSEAKKALDTAERLDPECYLAAVARIMIANHASPERAAKAFNTTFPEVAVEMNRIIASHFIHLSKPYVPRTSWA